MALRPKQRLFVKEYLIDLNATQAAIRAGYSKKTARFIATENLSKPNIAAEIEKAMAARAEKVELSAETVLRDIRLIKENAMQKDDEAKMIDKQAALKACELEGRHLKMFTDKLDVNAHVAIETLLDKVHE